MKHDETSSITIQFFITACESNLLDWIQKHFHTSPRTTRPSKQTPFARRRGILNRSLHPVTHRQAILMADQHLGRLWRGRSVPHFPNLCIFLFFDILYVYFIYLYIYFFFWWGGLLVHAIVLAIYLWMLDDVGSRNKFYRESQFDGTHKTPLICHQPLEGRSWNKYIDGIQ